MAFTSVADDDAVPDGIIEENSIRQMIHWCGFTTASQRTNLFNDSLSSFDDLLMMQAKDISSMAKDYAARTSANRIYFGVRRTKKLSSMLHFVQDFY